jgi:RNA polymerase sigma factor (sigma-70 family)
MQEGAQPAAPAGPDVAADLERKRLLAELLERFDERRVQIVLHFYYDEMTQAEISQLLGITERAVRKALKSFLERAGEQLAAMEGALREARP